MLSGLETTMGLARWLAFGTRAMASADPSAAAHRFLLWIDGVGGYLVCQADAVTIGQPVPGGGGAHVPVLGDIGSRHAVIHRDGEMYWIEPLRPVAVGGRVVQRGAVLSDGAQVDLEGGVRFRFRRPHPLSQTARLDLVSRHRTQPSVDGVLLLADTCVLGPKPASHVVCRQWPGDVVLSRHGDQLQCSVRGRFEVDGRSVEHRSAITRSSQIALGNYSLSLEPLA